MLHFGRKRKIKVKNIRIKQMSAVNEQQTCFGVIVPNITHHKYVMDMLAEGICLFLSPLFELNVNIYSMFYLNCIYQGLEKD